MKKRRPNEEVTRRIKMKTRKVPVLMVKAIFIVTVMVTGFMAFAAETAEEGAKFKILEVPLYAQQTPKWCWAAGGEMIMTYWGLEVPQCMQANTGSKRSDCCRIPRPGTCGETSRYPDFENYGFKYECSDKALAWDELVNQMEFRNPVGFSWEFTDLDRKSGGHYMAARGYILLNDIKLVIVNDPSPWNKCKCQGGSFKIISYSDYVEYPARYTHGYDDYDFKTEPVQDSVKKGK